jgi:hypothetical protein
MAVVLVVVIIILSIALLAVSGAHLRYRRRGMGRLWRTGARRILFPYVADGLSRQTLDAALRLASAEDATLVPVFLARVPLHLPIDTPCPRQSAIATALQDAIEHTASTCGISIDARIERGRTAHQNEPDSQRPAPASPTDSPRPHTTKHSPSAGVDGRPGTRGRHRWNSPSVQRSSGCEAPTRFLHRRQRGFGLRERTRAKVNCGRLLGDRDLLAGCGVATLARLLSRLDTHGQLHKTAEPDLLGVAQLLEHNLLERRENALGLGAGDVGAVGDRVGELYLSQRQRNSSIGRYGYRNTYLTHDSGRRRHVQGSATLNC